MTEFTHSPVMLKEVIEAFQAQSNSPRRLFEGTFGRGGHARALLEAFPRCQLVSFDRDQAAVDHANAEFGSFVKSERFQLVHDDFRNLGNHNLGLFDGALLDLGISSPQVDDEERGFSFMNDGPLDMRMDQRQKLKASEIINEWSEKELSDLFFHYGEVKRPNRVVRAIVHDRKTTPFETTRQLASMIERVDGAGRFRKSRMHPATNYFMAIRMVVNEEVEGLSEFIESMHLYLEPGSRFLVISFHSIEDRLVKIAFKNMHNKYGKIINKKVLIPSDDEVKKNPRSRSAKLRIFEMGGVS